VRNKLLLPIVSMLLAIAIVGGFLSNDIALAGGQGHSRGKVVIANRGSGTISVIDTRTNDLIGTYSLPDGENPPEPMYVVYSPFKHRVFVGDRANDCVVVFDGHDFSVEGTVPAGDGVFHMWANLRNRQLWVNNDVDKTATVIDPKTLSVLATVPMPADLVAMGGKPHDVILDPWKRFAYVTLVGFAGENDYVVKFSTVTFEEVERAAVGKDPHVSLTWRNNLLYVPAQNSNVVSVLNRKTLELVTEISVPGAHGAGMTLRGKVFYTTNLPGGGPDGLYAIDTRTNTIIGSGGVNTPYPVPHNIALTPSGRKLFVTHSGGAADKVTIYSATARQPRPVFEDEATVGLNPFGLAYVP
jgi:DNA-binding beta-propeller fold protein YncE